MAMRRFITYLAGIDPLLIDVMPSEKPPDGFPLDRQGNQICAKCNTVVGCSRPILDQHHREIRTQLFECPELQEGELLRSWAMNALENQRCVWGVHKPISKAETRPFMTWFSRPENRGFFAYDNIPIMRLMKDLLVYQYELVYDMQMNKNDYHRDDFNAQAKKVIGISTVYTQLSGETFVFEAPCSSKSTLCNARRVADGGKNHTHPVEIEKPVQSEESTHKDAVELRLQCVAMGLDSHIGVEPNIEKRCAIYRQRIAECLERIEKGKESRARNDARALRRIEDRKQIKSLIVDMGTRQIWDACHSSTSDHLVEIIKRGGDPSIESPRGLTPLTSMILSNTQAETIEEVIKLGVNLNHVNKYGFSALMIACRIRENKMIHILVRNGATITHDGKKRGNKMTALHWCAIHGNEEAAVILSDYIKENGGDSLRNSRYLDALDANSQTPLMHAAVRRNGLMCKVLTGLGANPAIRDNKGHTAAYLARNKGWAELADWLEKKVGGGIAKLETYSDLQYEKSVRYATLKVKEFIESFGSMYLLLIHGRSNHSPLGPPSRAAQQRQDHGDRALRSQLGFVDRQIELFVEANDNAVEDEDKAKFKPIKVTLHLNLTIRTISKFIRNSP